MARRAIPDLRAHAAGILAAARRAADPGRLVRSALTVEHGVLRCGRFSYRLSSGRIVLVAAGKAAAAMAAAAESRLGRRITVGMAVAPSSPRRALRRTRLLVASHPLPDARGLHAARAVERAVGGLDRSDLVLALLSGGASALLPAPAGGIHLTDKRRLTAALLRSGASIAEINTVRKHLSRLKGGGLARAAFPARVLGLVLSDVVGDDPTTIASGPLSPDPTTYGDAVRILRRRHVAVPASVQRRLRAGAGGRIAETPKPGSSVLRRVHLRIIGSNRLVLRAGLAEARRRGFRARIVDAQLTGEARVAGRTLVRALSREVARSSLGRRRVCLLAGGETTVRVRGRGRGGRTLEMTTAAVDTLARLGTPAVMAALATDGLDGNSGAAGACVDSTTLARARKLGVWPPRRYLADNDTAAFLEPLGELIRTGPTGTNLLDIVVLLATTARAVSPGRG